MKKCNCKCKFTEELKNSGTAIWLFAVCSFLAGIILGFFLSPIKKGVKIGCNNGNNTYDTSHDMLPYYDDDEDEIKF
ncbi:hypothetical protein SAMN02910265_00154 [Ruminococcus flavefaciens]|uniref:Uncharacterized protein n=1 Tax=Ruminococcus flavefaciens TaxID=1265 RepID=A0A1H6HU92_RUMFL|nr:hypothetical protein [Ruminococcus flavefaciens]SEH37710.1 hypothetical protein SAMN02910265_00154 [Ruminococcus flavefaciens]